MINILLNASITGGIIILLWFLTYPLTHKNFKASWHYTVLKISTVFMLIPISLFAPTPKNVSPISEQVQKININAETVNTINTAVTEFVFPAVQESSHTNDVVERSIEIPYLQIIWLVVAAGLFSNGIRKMHKFKKQILNNSSNDVEHETHELFLQCRTQLRINSKISLRTSEYTKTPFVFGLIKPIIIFPDSEMSFDEKRIALIHELTHIKNGDLWFKSFAFLISTIHWFNPFVHLLCRKISIVSEEYCDECVVKTMTQDERFQYGHLILKVVADITVPQSKFCSTLSAPSKNIKSRLINMMNTKKSRKSMVALSIITALILCSFATVYAFAANSTIPSYAENPEMFPDIKSIEEAKSTLLAAANDDGVTMYSIDAGETWITEDELQEQELPVGEADPVIQNYLIMSNDVGTFWMTKETFDKAYPNPTLTFWTYAEYKDWIENEKTELQDKIGESPEWTQEIVNGIIGFHETQLEIVKGEVVKISKLNDIDLPTFSYKVSYTSTNGKEVIIGFGALSRDDLYNAVKDYLDAQVDNRTLTQEEADNILSDI